MVVLKIVAVRLIQLLGLHDITLVKVGRHQLLMKHACWIASLNQQMQVIPRFLKFQPCDIMIREPAKRLQVLPMVGGAERGYPIVIPALKKRAAMMFHSPL